MQHLVAEYYICRESLLVSTLAAQLSQGFKQVLVLNVRLLTCRFRRTELWYDELYPFFLHRTGVRLAVDDTQFGCLSAEEHV